MRSAQMAQIIHSAVGTAAPAAHTGGWLRWFILGAIAVVALMAWVCLRGYAKGSDDSK